jgi:hypothetical protein
MENKLIIEYMECPTCKKAVRASINKDNFLRKKVIELIDTVRLEVRNLDKLKTGMVEHDNTITECQKKLLSVMKLED